MYALNDLSDLAIAVDLPLILGQELAISFGKLSLFPILSFIKNECLSI